MGIKYSTPDVCSVYLWESIAKMDEYFWVRN